jgi:hypothetical protein
MVMGVGDLGRLVVRIGADSTELNKELQKSESSVQGFAGKMDDILGGVSFFALAAGFTKVITSAVNYGDELNRLSKTTGLAAQEIARLKFAAEQTDSSMEGIITGFRTLSRNMFEASTGNKEAQHLFNQLGIEIRNTDGSLRHYNDVMKEVSDRLRGMKDEAAVMAIGQKLLGRSFVENANFFRAGSQELKNLDDQAKKLGMNKGLDQFAARADKAKDAWKGFASGFMTLSALSLNNMITEWKGNFDKLAALKDQLEALMFGAEKGPVENSGRANFMRSLGLPEGGQEASVPEKKPPQFFDNKNSLSNMGAEDAQMRAPENFYKGDIGRAGEDIKKFNKDFLDMAQSIQNVWKVSMTTFTTSFGSAFAEMIGHGKSFGDAIKGLWEDMKMAVLKAIGEMIAKWMVFMALKAAGGGFGLPFLSQGGVSMRAGGVSARAGLLSAANGVMTTGPMGETGIPAIIHPNEIVSPIGKFFDAIKSMAPRNIKINVFESQDPRGTAEMVALEVERRTRSV